MDWVKRFNLPPNFARKADSSSPAYVEQYGKECRELDALELSFIEENVERTAREYVDPDIWRQTLEEESEARKTLASLSEKWADVKDFLQDQE